MVTTEKRTPNSGTVYGDGTYPPAILRNGGPHIWAAWLPRLLTGENSCEWAAWFRARHDSRSWAKRPSDFDQTQWLLNHTALLNQQRQEWEERGYTVSVEGQNSFRLVGKATTLAGKPDLVARRADHVVVVDAKTGRLGPAHGVQVMLYQYALPRALERYKGLNIAGQVAY